MRKLALDLDALHVESFAIGAEGDPRGTVQANEDTAPTEFCSTPGGGCQTNHCNTRQQACDTVAPYC